MKKNLFVRAVFLAFFALFLGGCVVIVKPIEYHPEKLITKDLAKAVIWENYSDIMRCFSSDWVKVVSGYQIRYWDQEDAADFFYFVPNPQLRGTTVFDFTLLRVDFDVYPDVARVYGELYMQGLRPYQGPGSIATFKFKGKIEFTVRRLYNDKWVITDLDLSNFELDEGPIQTHSL